MSKPFLAGFAVVLALIAFLVWRGFVETAGNHLDPVGKIGKLRLQKVDENETVAIFDFSLRNDSDRAMVVRSVEGSLEPSKGAAIDGQTISAADLANVLRNYPELGGPYNPPLVARDQLGPHASFDRMVGVRFDVPDDAIAKRKDMVLKIEDITGPVAELKTR